MGDPSVKQAGFQFDCCTSVPLSEFNILFYAFDNL
jgi:hypothetical protein